MVSILASGPSCPVFDSQCSQFFFSEEKWLTLLTLINGAAEESGQWIENVDQTHLVLASG